LKVLHFAFNDTPDMPIYAYKCSSCGHAKDVLQKISDAPLTVCPACGAEAFSKQVTAAGFQLKGSGWYVGLPWRQQRWRWHIRTRHRRQGRRCSRGRACRKHGCCHQERHLFQHQRSERRCSLHLQRLSPPMPSLRKWLFTGLLVIVPGVITAWVLHWIVSTLDQTLQILPEAWQPDRVLGVHVPGFGVVLTLAILLVVGAIASNFAGRKLVQWGDALVHRIPVVRSIYSSVKQVSDTLFSENGNAFRKAVLVQWPREGVWTVAFVTGAPNGEVAAYLRDEFVSVYVPTTPNPTGGYFVMLRKSDCVELDMSVDSALKYIVSMGVVAPVDPTQLPPK
jgi:putative FmdB family regulatory protein